MNTTVSPTSLLDPDRWAGAGFVPCDCVNVPENVRRLLLHAPSGLHSSMYSPFAESDLARYERRGR